MNVFLSKCLQKLLAEKEAKSKQHAKLRTACEAALGEPGMVPNIM